MICGQNFNITSTYDKLYIYISKVKYFYLVQHNLLIRVFFVDINKHENVRVDINYEHHQLEFFVLRGSLCAYTSLSPIHSLHRVFQLIMHTTVCVARFPSSLMCMNTHAQISACFTLYISRVILHAGKRQRKGGWIGCGKKKGNWQREKIYIKTIDVNEKGEKKKEVLCEAAAANELACLSDCLQNSLTVDSTQKKSAVFSYFVEIKMKSGVHFYLLEKGQKWVKNWCKRWQMQ